MWANICGTSPEGSVFAAGSPHSERFYHHFSSFNRFVFKVGHHCQNGKIFFVPKPRILDPKSWKRLRLGSCKNCWKTPWRQGIPVDFPVTLPRTNSSHLLWNSSQKETGSSSNPFSGAKKMWVSGFGTYLPIKAFRETHNPPKPSATTNPTHPTTLPATKGQDNSPSSTPATPPRQ